MSLHAGGIDMMKGVGLLAMVIGLCFLLGGCMSLSGHPSAPRDSPIKVVVGPVILEAPLHKSTDIHSFAVAPSPEFEPMIMVQLVDELQTQAQRFLTEQLAHKSEFIVVPFDETRRISADLAPA